MIRRSLWIGSAILAASVWPGVISDVYSGLLYRRTVAELLAVQSDSHDTLPTVVVVFQPADCLKSERMLASWRVVSSSGKAQVVGRVVGGWNGSDQLARLLSAKGLNLAVTSMSRRGASLAAARLGYSATPFAVLLDQKGRVVSSGSASLDANQWWLEPVSANAHQAGGARR